MTRLGILNSDIARVLAYMGHTDTLAIGDCGLPVPDTTERIDLAIEFGKPSFMDVLKPVSNDMKIEKIVLAEEICEQNPEMFEKIEQLLKKIEQETGKKIEIEFVSHTELKKRTANCKAVIRSGEITPYANIILQSGCIFG